tara:strand:+ start:435 stop:1262 length:828 start_codon:yes stop_codon:yes gene_type:complete
MTQNKVYYSDIAAKSAIGVTVLSIPSAKALTRSAFFMPVSFMAGCMEALRSAAPRSGTVNSVQSVTTFFTVNGGSSQLSEDFIMSNLIPISSRTITGIPTKTASAKRLHDFLEIGRDFSTWIKSRIKQYGFESGINYLIESRSPISGSGNRGCQKDYFLTLDMAKELAMVERNEKGRQARRYFIECEKQLKEKQRGIQDLDLPTRFVTSINDDGTKSTRAIKNNAFITTFDRLPLIIDDSISVKNEELKEIIKVCVARLVQRATYFEGKARSLNT